MFDTYRAAFRTPGTSAFCTAGFVMRLPSAIYPLALVLLVSAHTGKYAFAGVLSGVFVVANGVGLVVLARVVDRFGQGHALLPATGVHVASAVILGVLAQSDAPLWTLTVPTAVLGFTYLPVGSLVRARWSYVLGIRPELATAYSLESALDEVIFTAGPLIASLCATLVHPLLGVGLGVGLTLAGAVWLREQRATEPPAHGESHVSVSPLRSRGMVLLCLTMAAMGATFASVEVTMVAFAGQHGHRNLSGLLLAAFAGGSAISGFAYGARHWHAPLLDRFRLQAYVFGVMPALFLLAANVPILAVIALVVGLSIAPTLITAFGLVQAQVPTSALTEGLAWLVTGLSVGYGAGSSLVGGIADAHGARWAFLVAVGTALLVAGCGALTHQRLAAGIPNAQMI
jgi:MFS family permease